MPNLTLTNQQVIELVKQLEREQQLEIFNFLLLQELQEWGEWESLSRYGVEKVTNAAMKRGYNWDLMNEAQREELIDEIVHEQ